MGPRLAIQMDLTNLDGVLEHGVIQLAEGEAKAAAHLRQADRELTNRRPGISFIFCLFHQRYERDAPGVSEGSLNRLEKRHC